jgi:hypothetical protein
MRAAWLLQDTHFWRFTANKQYSAKAAYEGLFWRSVEFEHYDRVWKTWAPAKCRYFLWLVTQRKCWTADRLARHGLDHPEKCHLCDQEEETMDHLLSSCIFSRQFWFRFLQKVTLHDLTPQPTDPSFLDWWQRIEELALGMVRKGLNSLIILGAWIIWKHRNRCVFDGAAPSLTACLAQAEDERELWELAGAKGISFLVAQLPGE